MPNPILPIIVEPEHLHQNLEDSKLIIVDMGTAEEYLKQHIPGAIHLEVARLRRESKPAPGLLPELTDLQQALESIGLNRESHVVAYDHDKNAKACRLLWTLSTVGHERYSLLNGGITAWAASELSAETGINQPSPSHFPISINPNTIAEKSEVLNSISDPSVQLIDARSAEEFNGLKSPSARKGHIPGAIHLNWLDTIDNDNNLKLLGVEDLEQMLSQRGIDKNKQIIVHCQTHQRSSHSFVLLKSLGFSRVKGYAGSWSEWANDPALPIVYTREYT